ncbi:MAG: hypothetical protein SFV18_19265 [Bryobacteraceae bacterium]|nr:hypothetical protein [Bryobacteraceae bacterium]
MTMMQKRSVICLLPALIAATGCGVTRRGGPKPPPAIHAASYLEADYKADLAAYGTADLAARTRLRDKMIDNFQAEIEVAYADFEGQLYGGRAGALIAGDFVKLGLGAAATLGRGERTKSILAALLTGVTGFDLSVDKNLFQQQTTQAIISSMRAARDRVRLRIAERRRSDDGTYSWYGARVDLVELLTAGTLREGVQQLHQKAAASAGAAAEELNVTLVAAVTPQDLADSRKLDAAVRRAFVSNNLAKVRDFLKALGSEVDNNTTEAKLEAEYKSQAKKAETDSAFRKKYFDEAKKAGLID